MSDNSLNTKDNQNTSDIIPNIDTPKDVSQDSASKSIVTLLEGVNGDKEGEEEGETKEEDEEGDNQDTKGRGKGDESLTLKLGDIIEITAPNNEILNNHVFIIEYIDPNKIKLVNADTFQKIQLIINKDGHISDKTISKITLLSRNENEGYARQNDLLTGTWVNIYFGGDIPTIITGLITNLEDDTIEIKTIDNDTIYIDFGYQGVPEDLPIETFEIRPPPESARDKPGLEADVGVDLEADVGADVAADVSADSEAKEEEETAFIPVTQVKEKISRLIIDADQIEFGDTINIRETVTIDRDKYRYDIESQKNDLLEEMISNIPNTKRSESVLNNLHMNMFVLLHSRQKKLYY